ncbi:hypothetical protein GCM10009682_41360 [Luedemannella flava]|uniref:DUF5709 domain-containing protein n=1 Tax=Luedemannella flava TaxID=349316 RepID=A0ABP4YGC7_9ACTN
MRQDSFPHPVSDPEEQGVPEIADDESTAYDAYPSVREADGRSPAPLPPDREDGPLGLDEYGVTADEASRAEPLDARLRREVPEVWATADGPLRAEDLDGAPIAADPHSKVSLYDYADSAGATVGRLVSPDEGSGTDAEPEDFAYDAGPAGGGASMEELAMHQVPDSVAVDELDEVEYDAEDGQT